MTPATAGAPRSLMAIDYGLRRIGIATAVLMTRTASPLTTLPAADGEPEWHKLDGLVKEWQPDLIVVGLPYNSDGSESEMGSRARDFAAPANLCWSNSWRPHNRTSRNRAAAP